MVIKEIIAQVFNHQTSNNDKNNNSNINNNNESSDVKLSTLNWHAKAKKEGK